MSVFILIDVQYLQNVVFSFENSSNGQNHSSSDSNHQIEKFLPAKFPHPLMLFWKPRVLKSSTYMLTRVFWHDLQHTTTPSKMWYFVTMVLTFLDIFFSDNTWFYRFLDLTDTLPTVFALDYHVYSASKL